MKEHLQNLTRDWRLFVVLYWGFIFGISLYINYPK